MKDRHRSIVTGALLVWAGASLLEGTVLSAQENVPIGFALPAAAVHYGWLGLLAIAVWHRCWRLGEAPPRSRLRLALTHVAMGLVVLTLWIGAYLGFLSLVMGEEIRLALRQPLWQAFGAFFTYLLLLVGIHAVQSSIRLREQRERAKDLLLLAREAEVKALKAQLHPHFLFNTLNSIYSLIESHPRQAQEMVGRLGELLRKTLEAAEERLVPLAWELELVEAYLAIEKIRLGSRLVARVEVEGDGVNLETPVLPFLLQPIVENAIKHGIAGRRESGEVIIRIRRRGPDLELRVEDSGPGLTEAEPVSDGRGLALTRRRLENAYGAGAFRMELANREPSGLGVTLRLAVAS